jgi:type II secretory pathway component PulF
MPTFSYRALHANGKIAEGMIDAPGRPDALRQIEILGLRPVNVAEKAGAKKSGAASAGNSDGAGKISFKFESKKVSGKELENFTRLLSSLLAAGVPLSRALTILCKEASSTAARAKWKEINGLVVDGLSLADAMARSPETFPRVYVAMVEAGETGGFLDVVLAQIAEFQQREKELKSKVMTAMLYPSILLVLALGVVILLLTFFIPKFQGIFNSMHSSLPMITQVIIAVSHVVRSYGIFVAAGLFGIGFLVRTWFVSEKGKRVWEGLILKSPLVGPLIAQFAMARFCRMLGTLIGAGVPLVHGLNVARRSIGNQILVDAVSHSIERVQQGGRLGQSLADAKYLFPSSILEMISVAEESGRLDVELVRIAVVTENDLDRNLKTAVAFAEPLLLFMIAGFIGTIFVGMLLPVLTMSSNIK